MFLQLHLQGVLGQRGRGGLVDECLDRSVDEFLSSKLKHNKSLQVCWLMNQSFKSMLMNQSSKKRNCSMYNLQVCWLYQLYHILGPVGAKFFFTLQRFLFLKPRVCSQLTEESKTDLAAHKISSHEVLFDLVDHFMPLENKQACLQKNTHKKCHVTGSVHLRHPFSKGRYWDFHGT